MEAPAWLKEVFTRLEHEGYQLRADVVRDFDSSWSDGEVCNVDLDLYDNRNNYICTLMELEH